MFAWREVGAIGARATGVGAGGEFRRVALVSLVLLGLAVSAWSIVRNSSRPNAAASKNDESQLDQRLQQAATLALGDRKGTIIVMDPQTGRVRALVNSELAVQESF